MPIRATGATSQDDEHGTAQRHLSASDGPAGYVPYTSHAAHTERGKFETIWKCCAFQRLFQV